MYYNKNIKTTIAHSKILQSKKMMIIRRMKIYMQNLNKFKKNMNKYRAKLM